MIERVGQVLGVLEGNDGRLFLGDQDGFRLSRYFRKHPFTMAKTDLWRRTLRRRARELKRRGIPYVFTVVPDAYYVCAEDLPVEIERSKSAPGDVFLQFAREIADITFVDPRRDLEGAKGLLEIYRKTDSHWSMYGAFVGYRALVDALAPLVPCMPLEARDVVYDFRPTFGDLGVNVVPERRESAPRTTIARGAYTTVYENDGYRRNGCAETFAAGVPAGRVFVKRDSFYTSMADYVARSFRDVLWAGTTTSFFLDEVDRYRPDVVVSEIGERRLFVYESDHRRDGFVDLYRADFSSARGQIAHRALLLLNRELVPQACAEIAALEPAQDDLDPDHAYALAQVFHAAGESERATANVQAALSSHPERPSYLSLAATIALARGDGTIATNFAERALALAPFNGYHHQIYVSALLDRGSAREARAHLDDTLREIDDARELFYLQSVACDALGDTLAAGEAIVQALVIDPEDAKSNAQASRLLRS